MREALVETLGQIMTRRADLYVLTADTGFHVFDGFRKRFPSRFLNVGICEANMIGMAAGLAHCGRQVFCYGIAPFVTARCLDQIRVDVCYANLPVRIVGVGGGLVYGPTGMTHHSVEDIALMCALPNMTVVCPGDPIEVRCAVEATLSLPGPCYLRLGKSGEPVVHGSTPENFTLGKAIMVRDGTDVAVITTGNMLAAGAATCDLLNRHGVKAALVSMHTVKPLDRDLVLELGRRCRLLATLEEHSIIGGLGSAVACAIAEAGLGVRLCRFGIPDQFATEAGTQAYFRQKYGLTPAQITERIVALVDAPRAGEPRKEPDR